MKKYTTLFFDADDTLFDYQKAEASALRHTCLHFWNRYNPEWNSIYKTVNVDFWKRFEKGLIDRKELREGRFRAFQDVIKLAPVPVDVMSEYYLIQLSQAVHIIDGAEKVLRYLSDNYSLYLLTNGIKEMQLRRLAVCGFDCFFKGVVLPEDAGCSKPDKGFFALAHTLAGKPDKSRVLMIGDSLLSDVAGAEEYGINSCWFDYKKTGLPDDSTIQPTFRITSLYELLNIL